MKKNKTKEMTDAVTNIMTWFVDEVTDILYPAIMEYEERKITKRDMRDEEASAKKAEVNSLAENLNQAMEKGLSRHQISLVLATEEEPPLRPEQEGALIPGGRKYYLIMPQQSGSEQDLCNDVTGFDAQLPQDVVTVIIEEISDRPLLRVVINRLSQSTTDPDRLANEALSHESISAEPKSWLNEEAVPGTSADKTPTGTEELAMLRALLPKVDLLAQLAAHYTEDEEGEERVEDDLESQQQWEEEEELQQIEETTPVKSCPYLWSPLGSFMDTEPSSVAVEGLSASLEAQTSLEWMSADTWLAWDREDSLDTAVVRILSSLSSRRHLKMLDLLYQASCGST
ncbi:hypothetical protein Y1Q_0010549 [Alligator mississippiensis]|uniref:Fibrous sheath-interacting protein 2 C-terminal domain-containing protein n=1 Tax=Alligator mississippiensis TaxID=8496 RepID=A0A151MUI4_ALLMI|nr:hypothetical protein Y1Q_0010549 [Alligator mississippiensis]